MDFSVDQRREGDVAIITVRGHLTTQTADLFSACARTALPTTRSLIVDLSRATDLDEAGLVVLREAERSVRQRGGTLRAAGVHGTLGQVFDDAGLWDSLGGDRTVEQEVRRSAAHNAAEDYFR